MSNWDIIRLKIGLKFHKLKVNFRMNRLLVYGVMISIFLGIILFSIVSVSADISRTDYEFYLNHENIPGDQEELASLLSSIYNSKLTQTISWYSTRQSAWENYKYNEIDFSQVGLLIFQGTDTNYYAKMFTYKKLDNSLSLQRLYFDGDDICVRRTGYDGSQSIFNPLFIENNSVYYSAVFDGTSWNPYYSNYSNLDGYLGMYGTENSAMTIGFVVDVDHVVFSTHPVYENISSGNIVTSSTDIGDFSEFVGPPTPTPTSPPTPTPSNTQVPDWNSIAPDEHGVIPGMFDGEMFPDFPPWPESKTIGHMIEWAISAIVFVPTAILRMSNYMIQFITPYLQLFSEMILHMPSIFIIMIVFSISMLFMLLVIKGAMEK